MGRKVFVVGVGMTKFEKPGSREWDYPDMAREAGTKALDDAGIAIEDIERSIVGVRAAVESGDLEELERLPLRLDPQVHRITNRKPRGLHLGEHLAL